MKRPAEATDRPIAEEEIARLDVPFTVVNVTTTALSLVLPFLFHARSAVIAFVVLYTVTGLGLTAGYHRLFSHHSYAVPKWLERLLCVAGYLAIQRGPIFWAAMHRLHHQHTDVPGKDPHSPHEGILHVHFGWMQKRRRDVWDSEIYRRLVPDLLTDPFYLWLDDERRDYATYALLVAGSFIAGGFIGPGRFDGYTAMSWLVWVGLLNRVAMVHAFGLVNSVCHLFGSRPHSTPISDSPTNNAAVALLIFGEGWHNNHHAFPTSARQGLRWYQFDPAWYAIWCLQKLGLARNVRLPSPTLVEKRTRAAAGPRGEG